MKKKPPLKKTVSQLLLEREKANLSKYASLSSKSKLRKIKEKESDIRTCFQKDRDRIIHSAWFRKLKSKTQVFSSPESDFIRTRLTHTLEVMQIARTIARALFLNEDLTEAVALAHDIGHTPFGHAGEEALNSLMPGGFHHALNSVRVADVLAKDGKGLNLTYEVREGILNHSKGYGPTLQKLTVSLEAQVVRISDRIAYLNHDLEDAVKYGILDKKAIPARIIKTLGAGYSKRLNTMIRAVINASAGKNYITMEKEVLKTVEELKDFSFKEIYKHPRVIKDEELPAVIIEKLFRFFVRRPEIIINKKEIPFLNQTPERLACDFISFCGDFEMYVLYKEHIRKNFHLYDKFQLKLF